MKLDTAINNYRLKAKAHREITTLYEDIQKRFFLSQRELMFAKDDLREAERAEKEDTVGTRLVLKSI